MSITIFRDDDARAIFVAHGSIGTWPFNSLSAVGDAVTGTISIQNLAKKYPDDSDFFEMVTIPFGEFQDDQGVVYGANLNDAVDALNAIFQESPNGGDVPVITSSLAINVTTGDSINYTLIATDGVGYLWASIPSGLAIKNGDDRNLLGVITAGAGTYNIPMTAVNTFGSDNETLVVTVAAPPYNNTKSVKFNNNDYCVATASTANPLYRVSNGSGSGDAWTISGWFKGGNNGTSEQFILSFGSTNEDNNGRVDLMWDASAGDKRLVFRYGSKNNRLVLKTPSLSVIKNTWYHFIVTYDGGTTGASSGDINDYYGRFEIFIDGSSQTLTTSHNNYGWSGTITDGDFRIGEAVFGGKHMRNGCLVDEIALWEGDETSNVASIYNSGTPHDLTLLGSAPDHYWRMGDGDVFPTLEDNVGSLNFTMTNMTSSDIVNDTP